MSGEKTIATLVGKLRFDVDSAGLLKFGNMLDAANRKMAKLEAQAKKKLNISEPKATTAKSTSTSSHAARMREFRFEKALQAAKRNTFKEELLQSKKLQFAGMPEKQTLLPSLAGKQALAVESAKIAHQQVTSAALKSQKALQAGKQSELKLEQATLRTQQQRLKVQAAEQGNQSKLEASKIRQQRLEKVLAAQQSKTAALHNKELQSMTSLQRAEMALQQLRANGARKAAQYNERLSAQRTAASKRQQREVAQEQRTSQKFQQQQQRFQWSQQRQQVWQANQTNKESNVGVGGGFDVLAVARAHPMVAGLAAVTTAIYALEQRIAATTNRVASNESYELLFEQVGGDNPDTQKFVRQEFERISNEFGTSVEIDGAKAFRTSIMQAIAGGKLDLEGAIKQFETQQAAFRASGMNATEQQRANIQLQQVRAKGRGDTEDYRTFSEAAPLLAVEIGKAWAKRTGFKGEDRDIQGAVYKALPEGNVLAEDYEAALKNFVEKNKAALERHAASIEAQQQRLKNEQFLQQQNIDQSTTLKAAIHSRIEAERELTQALQPLREVLAEFEAGLIGLTTGVLKFFFKSPETEVKEKQERVDSLTQSGKGDSIAGRMAKAELQQAQRKLLDKKLKSEQDIGAKPAAPYLIRDREGATSPRPSFLQDGLDGVLRNMERLHSVGVPRLPVAPDNSLMLDRLGTGLNQLNQAPQLAPSSSSTTTTDNRQVHVDIKIDGSNLSADEIASALEDKIHNIAKTAFSDGFDVQLRNAKTNLVQVTDR